LVEKEIPVLGSFPLYFIFIPAAMIVIVGLLAGMYPALVLSALKSVDSLKGKLKTVKENTWLRKSLVGFQFSVAAIVMIAAFIVTQQVAYFFSQRLGYNKEYIVASQLPRDWTPEGTRKMQMVRNEFAQMSEVQNVTLSYEIPNGMNGGQPPVYKAGDDSTTAIAMQQLATDAHYLDTYQIPMKAGSFFREEETDSSKVVLNEAAVHALGWKDPSEAIGQRVRIPGFPVEFVVQGVASDFHFNSMQEKMKPNIFMQTQFVNSYRFLSFKLKPGNIGSAIEAIQKKWAILLPGSSFEYNFMDQTLGKLYSTEIQLKKASFTATGLALIIVLLGVLGMVSLSIQKRIKEIGIRKVIGASLTDIVLLFVKEFMGIILIAGVLACPLSYLIMQSWLDNYNYRVSIGPQPFLWSVGTLCLVTLLLIIARTAKAALTNPVKSLRTE
jgi:ABC-type antimicrobial peptide transport system permease subunit